LFWNKMKVTTPMTKRRATSSATVQSVGTGAFALGRRLRMNGATRSTPIASPVHQTAQVDQKLSSGKPPHSTSTEVPTVALIVIAARAPSRMMAAASRRRSSPIRK